MRDEVAEYAYPIIDRLLDLRERLARGEELSLDEEQLALVRLLARELAFEHPSQGDTHEPPDREVDEIRFALVCLIDEFCIAHTPWSEDWNERKFESTRYGTNDRAWKFWRTAQRTLADGDVDGVELALLCVMLGFRGQMAEHRPALQEWVTKARALIEARRSRSWTEPPAREPRTFVPPLRGRQNLESAARRLGILILAAVSLFVFLLIQRLGS